MILRTLCDFGICYNIGFCRLLRTSLAKRRRNTQGGGATSRKHTSSVGHSPPRLRFQPSQGKLEGLTESTVGHYRGKDATVSVRELVQNSLDAVVEAGRDKAKIRFVVRDVPRTLLPGIEDYREALKRVKNFCVTTNTMVGGVKNIFHSLSSASSKSKISTLFVYDNGIGLGDNTMASLLDEGRSTKKDGGGSHGIGHQSAFGLSDMRYVLYGGLQANGERTAAGHAILGSQQPAGDRIKNSEILGKDGFLIKGFRTMELFGDQSQYEFFKGESVPRLIARALDEINVEEESNSGSVVVIPGFNNFGLPEEANVDLRLCESIIRVVAQNFFIALEKGRMQVEASVEASGTSMRLDEANIASTLAEGSLKRRSMKQGFPSGRSASESFKTFKNGKQKSIHRNWGEVQVFVRTGAERKSIALCRDGMWITSDLFPIADFGKKAQFDALVLVERSEQSGEIGRVIRDAEPGHHNQISATYLEDNRKDIAILRAFRKDLKNYLMQTLEDIGEDEFDLDDFLAVDISGGKRVPKGNRKARRARATPVPPPPPGPRSKPINVSLVRIPTDAGLLFAGSSTHEHFDVSMRLSVDLGADDSCDGFHVEFLPLAGARIDGDTLELLTSSGKTSRPEGFSVKHIPQGSFRIEVDLDNELTSNLLTIYPTFYKMALPEKPKWGPHKASDNG